MPQGGGGESFKMGEDEGDEAEEDSPIIDRFRCGPEKFLFLKTSG